MGEFHLSVKAVGGHGCDRLAKAGEPIGYLGGQDAAHARYCPDCKFRVFVEDLLKSGALVTEARETHWPGTPQEVADDVLNSRREAGQFGGG